MRIKLLLSNKTDTRSVFFCIRPGSVFGLISSSARSNKKGPKREICSEAASGNKKSTLPNEQITPV